MDNTNDWYKETRTRSTIDEIYTAGINRKKPNGNCWYNFIECHGDSKKEAEALRDFVLEACRAYSKQTGEFNV